MKSKKIYVFIAAILLVATCSLCACSKKSKEKQEKSLNVYVDLKDKNSLSLIKFLTEEYKKDNPQSKIKINDVLGGGSNIVTDIGKSSDTDIVITSRNNMLELAQKGLISDMSQQYEKSKVGDKYYNIVSIYGRINDKYYGIPILPCSFEVYYNADALGKIGISPLTNIKDIQNITKKLSSNNVRIPVVIPDDLDINIVLSSLAASNTIRVSTLDNIFDNKAEYSRLSDMQNIFNSVNTIVRASGINKNIFELGNESSFTSLANGSVPMVISTSYYFNKVKDAKVAVIEGYSLAQEQKERIPVLINGVLCTATNSKNAEEAGKFIKYVLSDDTQELLAKKGYITSNKKANEKLTGVASVISKHLMAADDYSIIYTYNLPVKFQGPISARIGDILTGNYRGTEWQDILNEVYK